MNNFLFPQDFLRSFDLKNKDKYAFGKEEPGQRKNHLSINKMASFLLL